MTESIVPAVLSWLAPPVLGAVIGAAATAGVVAVLLGGRSRARMARGVGDLVARTIASEGSLRALVTSPAARERIHRAVSSLSDHLLALPLGSLVKDSPSLQQSMEDMLAGVLQGLFLSRAMINGLRGALTDLAASWSRRRTAEILDSLSVGTMISGRLLPFLADPARRDRLSQGLAAVLADSAGDIFSDEVIAALSAAAEPFLPIAAERLAAWLQTEDVRSLMASRGRELIPRILERLNEFQRFLLSAAQYDKRLTEKMPEIVDDTVRTLQEIARDPAQQRKLLALGADTVRDWRSSLLADAGKGGPAGPRASLKAGAATVLARALTTLRDHDGAGLSEALLKGLFAPNQTLGGFLRESFGLQEPQVVDFLAERALRFLTDPATARKAAKAICRFVLSSLAESAGTTVGALLRLDPDRKSRLDAFLADRLAVLLDEQLPGIMRDVDVETLVARKIESLDIGQVRRSLPGRGRSPVRLVTLLGAGLGFLVGLAELLLRLTGLS